MAKDIFHEHVIEALEKDGWEITNDPLYVAFKGKNVEIDLGAEPVIGAVKSDQLIAVEIKSFVDKSLMYSFHRALGQFINYRRMLKNTNPERVLFLAIPMDVYDVFFQHPFGENAIEEEELKLLVFDPKEKKITKWIR